MLFCKRDVPAWYSNNLMNKRYHLAKKTHTLYNGLVTIVVRFMIPDGQLTQ